MTKLSETERIKVIMLVMEIDNVYTKMFVIYLLMFIQIEIDFSKLLKKFRETGHVKNPILFMI